MWGVGGSVVVEHVLFYIISPHPFFLLSTPMAGARGSGGAAAGRFLEGLGKGGGGD